MENIYSLESFYRIIDPEYRVGSHFAVDAPEYTSFSLPKKGGQREIIAVNRESRFFYLQQNLLKNYLSKFKFPVCVKGFIKNESYQEFLKPHIGSKYFLKIDIHDFFGTINESHIIKTFGSLFLLSSDLEKEKLFNAFNSIVLLNGKLPQGFSTSPCISNIVFANLDQRILKYCQILNVKYTRYADDLMFSSEAFDFKEKPWFLKKIKHILSTKDFKLNYSKTKYAERSISLNGFVVSDDSIRLSRKRLKEIRLCVAFVSNNEPLFEEDKNIFLAEINKLKLPYRELKQNRFASIFQLSQFLCGYRAFLISWIKIADYDSKNRKDVNKLIAKIEDAVNILER